MQLALNIGLNSEECSIVSAVYLFSEPLRLPNNSDHNIFQSAFRLCVFGYQLSLMSLNLHVEERPLLILSLMCNHELHM